MASSYLVSVITPDRVGLTRDIAQTVFDLQGNITQMRQTIVSGFFNLVFVTEHATSVEAPLHEGLLKVLPEGAVISIMVDPDKIKNATCTNAHRYVAIASGEDRPGMMLAISAFMADNEINIEDWSTMFEGPKVIHLAYITFKNPAHDLKAVQEGFRDVMAKVGFTSQICHENIFRATSEVAPINSILV